MRRWIPLVFIVATVVFSAAVYSRLPDQMVIHWNASGEPDGYSSRIFATFLLQVGALFVVLGTLLPRFKSNFFFGIRTPWTLSSERVWARTHRVGGAAMVLIGALLIVAGIFGTAHWLYVAIVGAAALVMVCSGLFVRRLALGTERSQRGIESLAHFGHESRYFMAEMCRLSANCCAFCTAGI